MENKTNTKTSKSKNNTNTSSKVELLLEALTPFAKAFDTILIHNISDDETLQKYFDANVITPQMTMGDFRQAWLKYNKCI